MSTRKDRRIPLLLVEDSLVLSQRLAEMLLEVPCIELVAVADSESSALACIARQAIAILVLDLHLRDGTGFGVLKALRERSRRPRVIVLTNYDLPEYKNTSMSLGAAYFLDKARDYDRLPGIVRELSEAFH